jgi:hypothetical protein
MIPPHADIDISVPLAPARLKDGRIVRESIALMLGRLPHPARRF